MRGYTLNQEDSEKKKKSSKGCEPINFGQLDIVYCTVGQVGLDLNDIVEQFGLERCDVLSKRIVRPMYEYSTRLLVTSFFLFINN